MQSSLLFTTLNLSQAAEQHKGDRKGFKPSHPVPQSWLKLPPLLLLRLEKRVAEISGPALCHFWPCPLLTGYLQDPSVISGKKACPFFLSLLQSFQGSRAGCWQVKNISYRHSLNLGRGTSEHQDYMHNPAAQCKRQGSRQIVLQGLLEIMRNDQRMYKIKSTHAHSPRPVGYWPGNVHNFLFWGGLCAHSPWGWWMCTMVGYNVH